jgi:hypothetical protein
MNMFPAMTMGIQAPHSMIQMGNMNMSHTPVPSQQMPQQHQQHHQQQHQHHQMEENSSLSMEDSSKLAVITDIKKSPRLVSDETYLFL